MDGQNKNYMSQKNGYLVNTVIQFDVTRTDIDTGQRYRRDNIFSHNEIAPFDLCPITATTSVNLSNTALKTVRLRRFESRAAEGQTTSKAAGLFSKRINAYYLPFKAGEGHTITLGTRADYFFTPTLNGCSLIIGTGNNPRVSHINLQRQKMIHQGDIDTMAIFLHGTNIYATVKKSAYNPRTTRPAKNDLSNYQAIVVGFRVNRQWDFYIQKYLIDLVKGKWKVTLREGSKI